MNYIILIDLLTHRASFAVKNIEKWNSHLKFSNFFFNGKGYFVRVTTLAEVREQVLKYIPVLSRPMVMYQKDHPLIWTPVYADQAVSFIVHFFLKLKIKVNAD